jgi:MraZ protein
MLRGNTPAKVDEKGRLKIPTLFRGDIEERHGNQFYITSLTGDCARVYPFPVWCEIENSLAKSGLLNPTIKKFLRNTSFYGQMETMDGQGRILIPSILRESAQIRDEVMVMGSLKYLEIWNAEVFRRKLVEDPFTESDEQALAALGI